MANKYQNEIQDLPNLDEFSFENIFNIHQDGDYYFYNLLRTVNFPKLLEPDTYATYRVKSSSPLTALSFKFYGTTKLWWLIVLANQINNPVQFIEPGKTLKIIKPDLVGSILQGIKNALK